MKGPVSRDKMMKEGQGETAEKFPEQWKCQGFLFVCFLFKKIFSEGAGSSSAYDLICLRCIELRYIEDLVLDGIINQELQSPQYGSDLILCPRGKNGRELCP